MSASVVSMSGDYTHTLPVNNHRVTEEKTVPNYRVTHIQEGGIRKATPEESAVTNPCVTEKAAHVVMTMSPTVGTTTWQSPTHTRRKVLLTNCHKEHKLSLYTSCHELN